MRIQKILLGGFPNGDLMIRAHKRFIKNYIQSIDSQKGKEERKAGEGQAHNEKLSFWYFLSEPHCIEEFSRLLFDILVFGTIRDENSDQIFLIPKWMSIFFELSSELNNWYR